LIPDLVAAPGAGLLSPTGLLWAFIAAQIITFATLVTKMTFDYVRDGRQRTWQVEDQERLALTAVTTASTLAAHTSTVADTLNTNNAERSARVETHLAHIVTQVKETKDAAHSAYQEANHVNLKLETLGLARNRIDKTVLKTLIIAGVKAELARTAGKR
jgi:hypothetical protein